MGTHILTMFRKGSARVILGVFLATCGVVYWIGFSIHEPHYRGRPASFWVEVLLDLPDPRKKAGAGWLDAQSAMQELGDRAVPALAKGLRRHEGSPYDRICQSLPEFVKRRLPDSRPQLTDVLLSLRKLGTNAHAAVPAVISMLDDHRRKFLVQANTKPVSSFPPVGRTGSPGSGAALDYTLEALEMLIKIAPDDPRTARVLAREISQGSTAPHLHLVRLMISFRRPVTPEHEVLFTSLFADGCQEADAWVATDLLIRSLHEEGEERWISPHLKSSSRAHRLFAAIRLARHREYAPQVLDIFAETIASGKRPLVGAVIVALPLVPDPRAVDLLAKAGGIDPDWSRSLSVWLNRMLESDSQAVREAAMNMLQQDPQEEL